MTDHFPKTGALAPCVTALTALLALPLAAVADYVHVATEDAAGKPAIVTINASSNSIVHQLTLPEGPEIEDVLAGPDDYRVWIARGGRLDVYDGKAGAAVAGINLPEGHETGCWGRLFTISFTGSRAGCQLMALSPGSKTLYVLAQLWGKNSYLYEIDTNTLAVSNGLSTPPNRTDIAITSDAATLLVPELRGHDVDVLEFSLPSLNYVDYTPLEDGDSYSTQIVVPHPGSSSIFYQGTEMTRDNGWQRDHTIASVNRTTNTTTFLEPYAPVPDPYYPYSGKLKDIEVHPNGGLLYALHAYDGVSDRIAIYDTWSGLRIGNINLETGTAEMVIHPTGRWLYVSQWLNDEVIVIDTQTKLIVAAIPAQKPTQITIGRGRRYFNLGGDALQELSATCMNETTGQRVDMFVEADESASQALSLDCAAAGLEYAPEDALSIYAEGRHRGETRR